MKLRAGVERDRGGRAALQDGVVGNGDGGGGAGGGRDGQSAFGTPSNVPVLLTLTAVAGQAFPPEPPA